MKKLMFLCLVLALFSMQSYAYTFFEQTQGLGSEDTYTEYFYNSTPSYVSVSVDAWNLQYENSSYTHRDKIFAQVQTYNNNSLVNSMSNLGEDGAEHSFHAIWLNVQQSDKFVIRLRNLCSSTSGQCWARIDYFY